MPTDPITVEVVCEGCEGHGTRLFTDGEFRCDECNGHGRKDRTLSPTSLAAAEIALARAMDRESRARTAYEAALVYNRAIDGPRTDFVEAQNALEAARAAYRAHPDYKENKND